MLLTVMSLLSAIALLQGCAEQDARPSESVTLTPKEMEELTPNDSKDTAQKDATSNGKDAGDKDADGKDADGKDAGGKATSSLPDLSNPEDRDAINTFLSGFSEIGLDWDTKLSGRFSRSAADAQKMAAFAVTWYLLNEGAGRDASAFQRHVNKEDYGDKYVPVSKLNAVLERLLGIKYESWEDLEKDKRPYRFDGSNVFWKGKTRPLRYGPAIAMSTSESDDGFLHVNFYAYYILDKDTHFSKIKDSLDIYSMRVLNSIMHVDKPNARGEAVLECERADDGWTFHLVSYEASMN